MLFYSFFKSLHGKEVVVELKNDLSISGALRNAVSYRVGSLQTPRACEMQST
jgi:hypothetical protein